MGLNLLSYYLNQIEIHFFFLYRRYLAPEGFYGKISFKSDIFSLGVTIIEILTSNEDYPDVLRQQEGVNYPDVKNVRNALRYRLDAHYSSFYFNHSLYLRRYIFHY